MTHRIDELPRQDLELLSAYIDGDLSAREISSLEQRLKREPNLQRALMEMRETVRLLRALPEVNPPRSYALTAETAGLRIPPPAYPVLRLATALATFAFLVVVGIDAISGVVLGAAREARQPIAAVGEVADVQNLTQVAQATASQEEEMSKAVELPEAPMAAAEAQVEAEAVETTSLPTITPCEECPETFAADEMQEEEERALSAAPSEGLEEQPEAGKSSEEDLQETVEPSPTPPDVEERALPTATSIPTAEIGAAERPTGFWTSLRVMEFGLAGVSLLLAGLTIWIRRRG
jgi:hypothetical protein